jgi:hypothetical protein
MNHKFKSPTYKINHSKGSQYLHSDLVHKSKLKEKNAILKLNYVKGYPILTSFRRLK